MTYSTQLANHHSTLSLESELTTQLPRPSTNLISLLLLHHRPPRILLRLPLQRPDMLPRSSHTLSRRNQRPIGLPFRLLRIADPLPRGGDRWVVPFTMEQAVGLAVVGGDGRHRGTAIAAGGAAAVEEVCAAAAGFLLRDWGGLGSLVEGVEGFLWFGGWRWRGGLGFGEEGHGCGFWVLV